MNWKWLTSPALGAVIGYFTNWLAVKMLFFPLHELRIGNIPVPFTPGLIPRERIRIAKAIGHSVGTDLLTEDALVATLASDETQTKVADAVERWLCGIAASDKTLGEALPAEVCGVIRSATRSAAEAGVFRGLVEDPVANWIAGISRGGKTIGDLLPAQAADSITRESGAIGRAVAAALADYLSSEAGVRMVGELIGGALPAIARPFATVLSPVAQKVAQVAAEQVRNPRVSDMLGDELSHAAMRLPFSHIESIAETAAAQAAAAVSSPDAIMDFVDRALEVKLSDAAGALPGDEVHRLGSLAAQAWASAVRDHAGEALRAVDIAGVVEDRINSLDIREVEEMIIALAQKELAAITWLGGVIGFVMGLIGLLGK